MSIKKKLPLWFSVLLTIALAGCNLPSGEPTRTVTPDLALTLTALAASTPTATLATSTPLFTPTPGFSPTPSVPTVSVSTNTNCRTGPGTEYDLIDGLLVGQTAQVVGKNTSTGYWIIQRLNGSGTCWLWDEYATVSGNTAGLAEYPIPPTPTPTKTPTPTSTFTPTSTPNPPAAITNLIAAKICIPLVAPSYQYTGSISWQDNSNNEKGFNIYLNGGLFGTVGPNITTYPIPPLPFPAGTPMTMSVEAFNDGGKSAKVDVIIICP